MRYRVMFRSAPMVDPDNPSGWRQLNVEAKNVAEASIRLHERMAGESEQVYEIHAIGPESLIKAGLKQFAESQGLVERDES